MPVCDRPAKTPEPYLYHRQRVGSSVFVSPATSQDFTVNAGSSARPSRKKATTPAMEMRRIAKRVTERSRTASAERLNPLTSSDEHKALFEEFARLEGARRRIREAGEAAGL